MLKKASQSNTAAPERTLVLILAGGKGERFWPCSRSRQPKQLLSIYSNRSMLAETLERARLLAEEKHIFIGCDPALRRTIRKMHPEIPPGAFIVEPTGRNTAPMIALAALTLERRFPGSIQIVLPADHYIAPDHLFQSSLKKAIETARKGYLVTLGAKPNRPESGYGYIHLGRKLEGCGGYSIRAFTEKPDRSRALRYYRRRDHYWNCGIFAWPGAVIIEEMERHSPEIVIPLKPLISDRMRLQALFPQLPRQPIDIAVLEKSDRIAMVPAEFQWDDLGAWPALERVLAANADGNRFLPGAMAEAGRTPKSPKSAKISKSSKSPAIPKIDKGKGEQKEEQREKKKEERIEEKREERREKLREQSHISVGSQNNLIASSHRLVALLGMKDAFLIEDGDILLLAHRKALPRIRELIDEIRKNPSLHKYL